jgi:hypothetical protein
MSDKAVAEICFTILCIAPDDLEHRNMSDFDTSDRETMLTAVKDLVEARRKVYLAKIAKQDPMREPSYNRHETFVTVVEALEIVLNQLGERFAK